MPVSSKNRLLMWAAPISEVRPATAMAQKNTRPHSRCAGPPLRTASATGAIKKPMKPAKMCSQRLRRKKVSMCGQLLGESTRKMALSRSRDFRKLTRPSITSSEPSNRPAEWELLQLHASFELDNVGRAAVDFQVDGPEQQVGEVVLEA